MSIVLILLQRFSSMSCIIVFVTKTCVIDTNRGNHWFLPDCEVFSLKKLLV